MKNSLTDLNEYLFQQLDALSNESLTGEALEREIERSRAIQGIAKTVIEGANVALNAKSIWTNMDQVTLWKYQCWGLKVNENMPYIHGRRKAISCKICTRT